MIIVSAAIHCMCLWMYDNTKSNEEHDLVPAAGCCCYCLVITCKTMCNVALQLKDQFNVAMKYMKK